MAYDFDKFRLGLNSNWEKENGFRAFLRATFSLAPYGSNGDYIASSRNLSNRAALNARVFLDKNYDGLLDNEDDFIQDAKVNIGRRETDGSKGNGLATYLGSPRNEYENITLDQDTLENPYMLSGASGYSAVLRPGTMITADFPVIETGLVDGVIETMQGPLAGVRVQLVHSGNIIDTVSTAFDGYYIFEYVEPGKYTIRLDPSYKELNIPSQEIVVTSENLFDYQVDFQIPEQADEVSCANVDPDSRITQKCLDREAQGRINQPAHTIPEIYKNNPTVENLRMIKRPDFIRLILDFNKKPENYKVIKPNDNEVYIVLSSANWNVMQNWKHPNPDIIKGYNAQTLGNGDVKVTIKPVNTIKILKSKILNSNAEFGHRIYFDIAK